MRLFWEGFEITVGHGVPGTRQTVVRGRTTLERLARVVRFLKTNEEGT